MVRLTKEEADQLLKGKSPKEILDLVRERVSKFPTAITDLNETLDWLVREGFVTEAELDAVEEESGN
jgi:hypothetical protein